MSDLPMTTFGGDGKALRSSETRPMEDHTEETTEAEQFDTIMAEIEAEVAELPELPTEEEAEKGELCETSTDLTAEPPTADEIFGKAEGQFSDETLVDDQTPDLIGVHMTPLVEPEGASQEEVENNVLEAEDDTILGEIANEVEEVVGDADTAEGQARRAEEAFFQSYEGDEQ